MAHAHTRLTPSRTGPGLHQITPNLCLFNPYCASLMPIAHLTFGTVHPQAQTTWKDGDGDASGHGGHAKSGTVRNGYVTLTFNLIRRLNGQFTPFWEHNEY